jgi:serine/threonine-protein phosphatase Stp1|tara:strand:- start:457 stop:1173 length:717 start_codon:yes stop_codon:yes gene_type:complete
MTQIRYSATTHVGHKRKVNEDSILALPDQQIWVVADGMGGHAGGDFASQSVVDSVAMIDPTLAPVELLRAQRETLNRAHEMIQAESQARGGITIGSTVVTFAIAEGHFAAFWAGDSRLYRLQGGNSIEMLTTDHSVVADFVMAGEMSWDEAEHHPQSNAITRAIGVSEVLELDKIRGEIFPGDRFLLCSDGLTKYATFSILERVLSKEPIETIAETLQQIALDGGGADNISIIVIDII